MNWEAVSFDWNQIRAFLATVEEGSFSAAARALRTTQPTIGRQISELEGALAVTLLSRTVKGPSLTEAGRELLGHVRAMGEAATLISMAANGHSLQASGEVVITASDLVSSGMLPAVLAPLRQSCPGIRVRVVSSNEIQSLVQREADIAIRHVRPEQAEFIGRHVGNLRANLYAATHYLDRAGRPRTPREVADHSFVGPVQAEELIAPLQNRGIPVVAESIVLSSTSGAVVWEHLKAGYGISLLPEELCAADATLEKVLPGFAPVEFPVWLVAHRELHTSKKIRVVFDQLALGLGEATGAVDPTAQRNSSVP